MVVLSGPAGVGKTSLSVHVAHLLRPSYPDGQIFISLCGFRGEPGEALGRILRALGVMDAHHLDTVEDKLARYRAAISDKRTLIVLDDAASAEEVRPLVPGAPRTTLIVTSRARLTTLAGAEHIELRMLSQQESLSLLCGIIGEARVAADTEGAAVLAHMCAGLPLALRIVGARLTARPHWPISRLIRRMSDERHRLDEMTADGLAVQASMAVSYQGLAAPARRMFRLLGYLAAPDFAEWLAVALVGDSVDAADELLEQLIDARLLEVVEATTGSTVRYRMHDLVRLYAQERAVEEESAEDLRAAVAQVVAVAVELVERHGERPPYAPRLYRKAKLPLAVDASALARGDGPPLGLDIEGARLVSTVERAAASDRPTV